MRGPNRTRTAADWPGGKLTATLANCVELLENANRSDLSILQFQTGWGESGKDLGMSKIERLDLFAIFSGPAISQLGSQLATWPVSSVSGANNLQKIRVQIYTLIELGLT